MIIIATGIRHAAGKSEWMYVHGIAYYAARATCHAAPGAPEWTIVRMPCVVVVVVVVVFCIVRKQVDGVPAAVTEARSG